MSSSKPPGHKNATVHLGPYRFKPRCSCGWEHKEVFGTESAAYRRWRKHAAVYGVYGVLEEH